MYEVLKRIIDITLALILLLLLSPLMIIISVIIFIQTGFPIFYKQERVGKDWRSFNILKFRTMIKNADIIGPSISMNNDTRITQAGRILRKYKLDELPQLFNVLFGDMSFVGPRPEIFKFAKKFKTDYANILKIKPGISDYASIKYADEASLLIPSGNIEDFYTTSILPEKIKLYHKYIDEMSFYTDVKIMFATVKTVIK